MVWHFKNRATKEQSHSPDRFDELTLGDIQDKVKDFVCHRSQIITASELTNETILFSSGILDSLAFIEMVLFLETEFDIKISDAAEASYATMDSPRQIANVVEQAKAVSSGRPRSTSNAQRSAVPNWR